ncbi:hypothetical protein SBRCBS47491_002849 [Sporothrix bragantina]|uniref:Alpha-1,2-mannosidase n=1 Tax=Sporothrix bragantina TaxID=671064 RepID=A0ABP0BAH6_9PEZI
MPHIRLVGRRRSRFVVIVFFALCILLLLPTPRHELGNALYFALFSPSSHLPLSSLGSSFSSLSSNGGFDVIRYINPLIGTVNGGHVFPGATLPYGMAKAVADTNSPAENAAGFVSDNSKITGFSHMHDSGTGGSPSMGNFPLFMHPGCPHDNFEKCEYPGFRRAVFRRNDTARASPGYFAIELNNSVSAEMTATQHAALYRFSFPDAIAADARAAARRPGSSTDDSPQPPLELWCGDAYVPYAPLVLVDLSDLGGSRTSGGIQVYPESGRIIGDGRYQPSFGMGHYNAFFCADFKGATIRKTGVFAGTRASDAVNYVGNLGEGYFRDPHGAAGAWIQFEPPAPGSDHTITARVGVSFISTDQACANAEAEIPDWDFDETVHAAQNAWREKLSPIQVDAAGVSSAMQTTFWSGLYRTLLSPQNYTGENQKWESDEPYYDSFYCIWDSFRAQHPLLTIIDPVAQTDMVRALLDIYRHDGKLPDCRMSFCKGYTQGGSNADVVVADAFVKNLTAGIDWATAYAAVVSDAEVEPGFWGVEGRGSLESYHALGYIPWNDNDVNGTGPMSRTISRLVEYAYDDFAISLLAKGLLDMGGIQQDKTLDIAAAAAGQQTLGQSSASLDLTPARLAADAAKYHGRGANWRNIWNAEQRDLYRDTKDEVVQSNFVGFLQPRLLNGTWRYHNTRRCSPIYDMHSCYYDTAYDTYEGSPWLYSFYAPQDMRTLVQLMGGPAEFTRRLHYFHESGIAYMGNEQTFLPVFQFHYAGRPGLSSYWAHRYIPSLFNATVNGIPGNDDCAMGAFSAFVYMGFFPVAGQSVYLLTAPFFREVRIRARNGRDAVFRVRNFDPTYAAKYIQSATLNGKPYTRNWISHDIFMKGGVLEYTVGTEEGTWGTRDEDLPPSYYGGGSDWKGIPGNGEVPQGAGRA